MKGKELKEKKPQLEEIQKKMSRFRWQNYLKDYTGDLNRIQFLYWNLVYNDIIGRVDFDDLSRHIAKSYLGIFFWPHRCYKEILRRFDGLEFYQLDLHGELWDQWKAQVLEQRENAISDIVVLTHREPPQSPLIYSHHAGDFWVDWKSFDHYYTHKTQAASVILKKHLRPNRFWFKDLRSPEISLPYELDDAIIKILHRNGEIIARSAILYRAFSQLEADKDKYLSSQDTASSANKSYEHLQLKNTFSADQLTTPTQAIKLLLEENPDFKKLSLSQMKHIIQIRFLNVDGKPLIDNSLSKALQRAGFSN